MCSICDSLKEGIKRKFTSSKKWDNQFETSHYNGVREALFKLDSKDQERIEDRVNPVRERYPEIKEFLNQMVDEAPKDIKKEYVKHVEAFDEDRFNYIIDIAIKDHLNGFGVREFNTTWKRA